MFHDSPPSQFKKPFVRAKMSVVNRYHVMTRTLNRRTLKHHLKFVLSILVGFSYSVLKVRNIRAFPGKLQEGIGLITGVIFIIPSVVLNLFSFAFGSGTRRALKERNVK